MKIAISKSGNRSKLVCTRENGTFVVADLGPNLPYHDLAHYVIENKLRLRKGFWGMISSGYSISELSDKNVIITLDVESLVSEVIARALQSLASGACSTTQFIDLINAELTQLSAPHLALVSSRMGMNDQSEPES
jgi:hypothetical protein